MSTGQSFDKPLTDHGVLHRWEALNAHLGIHGLWNYDLRRTLTCTLGNELHYDDHTIRAIINHYKGSALRHYYFKSFDSLTEPIQAYADWLWVLKKEDHEVLRGATVAVKLTQPVVEMRAAWHNYPG